ncbi:MAG TPA: alpha/beta hydrolase [Mycobacteriales bacterium]|nr:alpha/beta hydrolase [Mycobacteriales bacterium]
MARVSRVVEAYGDHPLQCGEWFVPEATGRLPTVVLIHGGFWRERYDRHLEDPLALDLAARGYLCWNIDYRSAATGWPATLLDAAAAYDHIAVSSIADRVDSRRIAVVGHSAGGQLAAWLASRHRLPPGAPGSDPALPPPEMCIPQSGVVALAEAARRRLGDRAVLDLIGGGPDECPDRYAVADPIGLLPTGVHTVVVHTVDDTTVPIELSEAYVAAARAAGDDATLVRAPGGHYDHLDPVTAAADRLREALGEPQPLAD